MNFLRSLPGDEPEIPEAGQPVLQDEWRIIDLISSDELVPKLPEFVRRNGGPNTIAGWKALADGLLTNQSCVFHRNLEISSCYAWIYKLLPAYFKWAGFEAIDRGRRVLESGAASTEARRVAEDLIWEGNVQLLEHEQRLVVQPNFDRVSRAFARLFSMGSTLSFEVHGFRNERSYFTSFYLYSLTRGTTRALGARAWPRITRFDDRWRWIETSIVPRFRRFDADVLLVDAGLRRIFDDARNYASHACVLPPSPQADELAPIPDTEMASVVIDGKLLEGTEG